MSSLYLQLEQSCCVYAACHDDVNKMNVCESCTKFTSQPHWRMTRASQFMLEVRAFWQHEDVAFTTKHSTAGKG